LLDSEEDVAQLKIPAVGAARTGEYVKAIAQAVGMIQDRPVFAGVIGPFSLSARLMGMTETKYHALDEPEEVEAVLDKATTFLLDYIRAFREAGAHGIVMAEPAAGLLSPDWNARFSAPYVTRIVSEIQSDTFPVIYHNCGNTVPLIDEIVETGAKAFHFGNAIRLSDLIAKIPADRLVMGNIDPASQFTHGTPDSIRNAVRSLVDTLGEQPNFVLSSGCDIPPKAPLANIDAFFEAAGY
jgi:uroporphyrinogen decarboxylase